ncbi:sorting nexin-16-like isoform X2 [Parambassis ranga]|uniref:Sorting nexin-16 n=1 Tax=Parambassis ranga TaxID=210632 RepID=A0A6P7K3J8_9TELE|nr:sorting nexin-16-like isoform X2 [Parambassis ranga]
MAAPFVPIPFPGDLSYYKRDFPTSGNVEPSLPQRPWGAAFGSATSEESWDRSEGGSLEGAPVQLLCEESFGGSWIERPITPTLLGYKILEERAKFTVYKILVTGSKGDNWVIFRRYTDFCRLSDKLKELFPRFHPALPPKRWFKDNYDEDFLEERQVGLQTFLQSLTLHKDVIRSEAVRHFLCLADPPSLFDSLEESRAFCETLEETNHHLQRELLEKQREFDTLKKTLEDKENHLHQLLKKIPVTVL